MNRNDYKQILFYAAEIFNERMGTTFNEENLVLSCFQTSNQEEVFEQFCKQYFPDRLTDHYKEEGYFDFHASAFIGEGKNSVDGILLRTDIERTPTMLYHILLHELAHVFCAHNELGGDSFYKRYCMDSTLSHEEDGAINAGYAIWRELIAEVIAFEMDDNCFVVPLREKTALLQHYEEEFENGDRKRGISMILCEALTSKECEMSATWNVAQKKVAGHKPFDNPLFMDMLGLVFRKLRDNLVEIDRDFILELGSLYLCLVTQLEIRKLQRRLQKKSNRDIAFFIVSFNYERFHLLGSNAHSLFHEFNISSIRGGANLPPKAVT